MSIQFVREEKFGTFPVRRHRLSNGLEIFLLRDTSAPVVSYHTWYKVGSRHEKHGKTGLAHLFEHLMFNETENHKAGEFDRKLEENGAETNAATWVDWTFYYESVPADRVDLVVELESERMSKLVLREQQVTSEKEVVANERRYRVEDDVEGAASELLYKTAFEKHPYHWPTIGWMEDIQAFTPEDCLAFYRTYYAPNNASVIVVGDFEEDALLRMIDEKYGPLPSSSIPEDKFPPEPEQTSERRVTLKKPTPSAKVILGYKGPALDHPDHLALLIMNEILFGGRAARIYRSLITEQEIATDVRGWVSTFRDPGLVEFFVTGRAEIANDVLETGLDREIAKLIEGGVDKHEMERAIARTELAQLHGLETTSGRAEQIGFNATVLNNINAGFERLEELRALTPADILRVAKTYLVKDKRTVVWVEPSEETEEAGTDGETGTEEVEA